MPLKELSPSSSVHQLKTVKTCPSCTLLPRSAKSTVLACLPFGRRQRQYSILHGSGRAIKHFLDNFIALTSFKIDAIFYLLFLQYLCRFSKGLFLFCQTKNVFLSFIFQTGLICIFMPLISDGFNTAVL